MIDMRVRHAQVKENDSGLAAYPSSSLYIHLCKSLEDAELCLATCSAGFRVVDSTCVPDFRQMSNEASIRNLPGAMYSTNPCLRADTHSRGYWTGSMMRRAEFRRLRMSWTT